MNRASVPVCAFTPRTKIDMSPRGWLATTLFIVGRGLTLAPAIAGPRHPFPAIELKRAL
jgi:hypothetical protein